MMYFFWIKTDKSHINIIVLSLFIAKQGIQYKWQRIYNISTDVFEIGMIIVHQSSIKLKLNLLNVRHL